uniref:MADF domain-containing protein n=1 Tax=Steinernema glaseri TaxID=37863 RepID=A0A1I7ZNA5_9BILA
MCILRQYGEKAMDLLLHEVEKQPTLYPLCAKPYRDSVAWGKVLENVQKKYPGVTDKEAWRSWYCFRYNYQRKSCSQKWKQKMSFVDDVPFDLERSSPSESKTRKRIRVKEEEGGPRSVFSLDDVDLEDMDEAGSPLAFPAEEDCFDHSKKTKYEPPKRNPQMVNSNCLLRKYGDDAMEFLVEEISKYPSLYPLTSKPYRDSIAWGKVLEAVQNQYPGVTDKEAWRSWYCFRYNYHRKSCSQKWREKMRFVDAAPEKHESVRTRPGGPKVHKFTGGNPLQELQRKYCPPRNPRIIKYEDEHGNLLDMSAFDNTDYGSYADYDYSADAIDNFPEETPIRYSTEDYPSYSGDIVGGHGDSYADNFEDDAFIDSTEATGSSEVMERVSQYSHIIGGPSAAPKPAPPPPQPQPSTPKVIRLYSRPPNATGTPASRTGTIIRRINPSQAGSSSLSGTTFASIISRSSASLPSGLSRTGIRWIRAPAKVLSTAKPGTQLANSLKTPKPDPTPITLDDDKEVKPILPTPVAHSNTPSNDSFRSNLRSLWTDLEKMDNKKKHLSILKKGIMQKLNETFAEM